MQLPKGLIFDMDGTLIDSMFYWRQAPVDCLRETYGIEAPEDTVECMKELTIVQGGEVLRQRFGLPDSGEQVARNINGFVRRFYSERAQVRPGAHDWLDRFRDAGIPMVIATSTDRALVEVALEHCGLAPYFDTVFTATEVGAGKGKPDIYEAALAHLGTPKAESWVFEDSLFAMHTAKNAGFPVAGVYDITQDAVQDEVRALVDLYIPAFDAIPFPF